MRPSTTGPKSRHLIGDAAHRYAPSDLTVPQGILDARWQGVFARIATTPTMRFRSEAHRRPATSAIVLANRGLGPEMPMRLVHERAPEVSTTSMMSSAPKKFSRSPTAIDEPLASRSKPSQAVSLSTAMPRCRSDVTPLPAYRPERYLFIVRRPQLGGHKV